LTVGGATGELWTCPRCGHGFVTANVWHSCTRFTLDDAFARSRPIVRAAFERYVELIERCGPVTVIAQKTRIVVMAKVRFAGATVLRDRVRINFALGRRVEHEKAVRIEEIVPGWIAHRFEVRDPADVDALDLGELVCEAYRDFGLRGSVGRRRAAVPPSPRA
jgi:ribosomal protein S27AE